MWLDLSDRRVVKQVVVHHILVEALLEILVVCNIPPSDNPRSILS